MFLFAADSRTHPALESLFLRHLESMRSFSELVINLTDKLQSTCHWGHCIFFRQSHSFPHQRPLAGFHYAHVDSGLWSAASSALHTCWYKHIIFCQVYKSHLCSGSYGQGPASGLPWISLDPPQISPIRPVPSHQLCWLRLHGQLWQAY